MKVLIYFFFMLFCCLDIWAQRNYVSDGNHSAFDSLMVNFKDYSKVENINYDLDSIFHKSISLFPSFVKTTIFLEEVVTNTHFCYKAKINNCNFLIGVSLDSSQIINYIETEDTSFVLYQNYKIGMTTKEVENYKESEEIIFEPWNQCFYKHKNNWLLLYQCMKSNDADLKENRKIISISKNVENEDK